MKPTIKPARPEFSSGPCAKHLGWQPNSLNNALLGRSHRSTSGKEKLLQAIEKTRSILNIPAEYRIGIVPASDTGAVEMALWSLLGPRPVDIFSWESFGAGWVSDITKQLKINDVQCYAADYGLLPDLNQANPAHDIVFTWNGTTSGVRVPNGDWIAEDREGLTICDATSAAFAMVLPWEKLDVTTYSWQKVLGGEAAHGMIILSPRAVERLESYTPPWPMPKIFRMTKDGKVMEGIFQGATINTPSMLCVEDYLVALEWAEKMGGLQGLVARCDQNFAVIEDFIKTSEWANFLAVAPETRSTTSVCLTITGAFVDSLSADEQKAFPKKIVSLLDAEGVAYDFGAYAAAPAGLRIWAGATVETDDLKALMPWLDWAYGEAKKHFSKK